MFSTRGIPHVASVTELRVDPTTLLECAQDEGVLIQKNGRPRGALISLDAYEEYQALKRQAGAPRRSDTPPREPIKCT